MKPVQAAMMENKGGKSGNVKTEAGSSIMGRRF